MEYEELAMDFFIYFPQQNVQQIYFNFQKRKKKTSLPFTDLSSYQIHPQTGKENHQKVTHFTHFPFKYFIYYLIHRLEHCDCYYDVDVVRGW